MRRASLLLNLVAAALAAAAAAVTPAIAGPVTGFTTHSLGPKDDGATLALSLGFRANFFGTTYSDVFISNNGYVTFNAGQSSFVEHGLASQYSGQPIIAPFYADVDTTGTGSGVTSWGTGTYAGHTAFGATWPGVGYAAGHYDKLNTFQVILTNRSDIAAGDFNIYFNYNQIQWETGDFNGGTGGLGGVSAAVGLNAGVTGSPSGTYYQLPGSLVNGALIDGGPEALISNTNDGVPGQYLFQFRNGQLVVGVPEPASTALLGVGLVGLAVVEITRRKRPT